MEDILRKYVHFIRVFENSLKVKYKINKNPCEVAGKLFELEGYIDGINYRFHGTGCTMEKNSIVYTYDISIF